MRRLRIKAARAALVRAERAARKAGIPALMAEVESAARALDVPAARSIRRGKERLLSIGEVEALMRSQTLIVDACRQAVRDGRTVVSLSRRPVLFALARMLAEAWPADVPRGMLIARVFRARHADDTHRARLRVEMGRLRRALAAQGGVTATKDGYALLPHGGRDATVLAFPVEDKHAPLLACLADGESWSSSGLAQAVGASQRTVQRALDTLAAAGKIQSLGQGRSRRWMTRSLPGFATTLLLPVSISTD
jgi:hypothetical protein